MTKTCSPFAMRALRTAFQARVDRLDERGFLEADVRRQRDHSAFHQSRASAYIFRETAAVGIESRVRPVFL